MWLRDFVVFWPPIEAALLIFAVNSVLEAWRGPTPSSDQDDVSERSLGATIVLAQLNGIITGSSIIIAGIGAFIALSAQLQGAVAGHLRLAAIYAVAALAGALYTMSTLPTRTRARNFVSDRSVAVLCAIALLFVIFAGARFMFGAIAHLS